jgi:uncharacterized BrkB/YihY/UPF0761 family membrane protein
MRTPYKRGFGYTLGRAAAKFAMWAAAVVVIVLLVWLFGGKR